MTTLADLELSPAEREAIDVFRAAILKDFPDRIDRIVLYGSKARGDWNQDSDVDLLLVVDGDWRDVQRAASRLSVDSHLDRGVFLSAKAIEIEHYERMRAEGWAFYRAVEEEGIEVWRRN